MNPVPTINCQSPAHDRREKYLVLHYTAVDFQTSLDLLAGSNAEVSAHYLIPQRNDPTYTHPQLQVYQCVPEHHRAWHAGDSHWGQRPNLNDTSIGIENVYIPHVNPQTQDILYPNWCTEQIDVLIRLCQSILTRHPDITPNHVVGHSDIAFWRKQDPGPKFPWHRLFEHNIGAWYDEDTKQAYLDQFQKLPIKDEIIAQFVRYGYRAPTDNTSYAQLIAAFQMHFRNSKVDGQLDSETIAILYALVDKYHSTSATLDAVPTSA
ncbi:MAG: N-acetylmuramoyl-L-alanine amidase [Shewanellaceae bacterium]|nr:N-acetylmuramoyl-L-alanine amidase [Shewanellaceae bacterium]